MNHDKKMTLGHRRELGRALTNGLAGWLALVTVVWIRHWTTPPTGPMLTAPWVVGALSVTVIAVYARNFAQNRTRPAFAALRSAAHLLFGIGAPAAVFLLAILGAPHGMSTLPRIGLPIVALCIATILGYVLIRFVIVPGNPDKTTPPWPHETA